jgi:diaminopimelate epimerase
MTQFIKYHSLSNDFIFFDWRSASTQHIDAQKVRNLCARHTGIGADGVLILREKKNLLHAQIINADGSNGSLCLNGIRCIADYLFEKEQHTTLSLHMGGKEIVCTKNNNNINMSIAAGAVIKKETISIDSTHAPLHGHTVDVGNPHFIILEKISRAWLAEHGHSISQHSLFPNQANITFAWPEEINTYHMITYERGAGLTGGCSSAAVALMTLLCSQEINTSKPLTLAMPGGSITASMPSDTRVILYGEAHKIFTGSF